MDAEERLFRNFLEMAKKEDLIEFIFQQNKVLEKYDDYCEGRFKSLEIEFNAKLKNIEQNLNIECPEEEK